MITDSMVFFMPSLRDICDVLSTKEKSIFTKYFEICKAKVKLFFFNQKTRKNFNWLSTFLPGVEYDHSSETNKKKLNQKVKKKFKKKNNNQKWLMLMSQNVPN